MSTLKLENIKHENSSSNNLVLDSDGNVIIGTGSDIGSKLSVNSQASFGTDNNNRGIIDYSSNVLSMGTIQSGTANFSTVNVTGGKVGIGTVNPEGKTHIQSEVNAFTNLNVGTNYHLNLHNPENDINEAVGLSFSLSTGHSIGASIFHERKASSSAGDLMFATRPSGGNVTERMRIDSTGRVTTPYQPNVRLTLANHFGNGNTSPNYPGNQIGNFTVNENIGNHWSSANNNFTCPVAGVYCVSVMYIKYPAAGAAHVDLHKNGSDFDNIRWRAPEGTSSYEQVGGTVFVSCAANDILDWHYFGNPGVHSGNGQWSIRLVG